MEFTIIKESIDSVDFKNKFISKELDKLDTQCREEFKKSN